MLTNRTGSSRGFTLIELMIGLVILGILIVVAMPTYSAWMANTQIRNLAESLQNGLRLAQSEAAKRNAQVDFVLTTSALYAADPTNATANLGATATSWVVRQTAPAAFIQGKSGSEGTPNATLACVGACPAGFDGTVSFSGLGRTMLGAELTLKVCNPTGGDRPLGVIVSTAGSVRMCNPRFGAGDPQGCPAAFTCP
jgi:type IV fimbrial biogenesis protein FimT